MHRGGACDPGGVNARRTNVALLVLVPLALVTGGLAYLFGTPTLGAAVVVLHGAAGLGVVALAPWKQRTVRRGLRRRRSDRASAVTLAVLAVTVVVTGVAHAAGLVALGPWLTTLQVHVGAAILLLPLFAAHAWARPSRPRAADLSRRALLRHAGLAAAAGGLWLGGEGAWRLLGTRGADRRFTGSHERGSGRPEAVPVTQWWFDTVPDIDAGTWRLQVRDARGDRDLAFADLDAGDRVTAVLDCTGGWWSRQEWSGIRLDHLLGDPGGARSVVVRSVTGYDRRFPVADLAGLWLATRCGGRTLSPGHGAPARLVAPGRRGFQWVKWVAEVRLDPAPPWAQPPFPLQ